MQFHHIQLRIQSAKMGTIGYTLKLRHQMNICSSANEHMLNAQRTYVHRLMNLCSPQKQIKII